MAADSMNFPGKSMKIRISYLLKSILLIMVLAAQCSRLNAMDNMPNYLKTKIDSSGNRLNLQFNFLKDSVIARQKFVTDSLIEDVHNYSNTSIDSFKNISDSILIVVKDTIDLERFDSLKMTSKNFENNLSSYGNDQKYIISSSMNGFKTQIENLNVKSFNNLNDASDSLDSIQSSLIDSLSSVIDDFKDSMQDSLSTLTDSLSSLADSFTDEQSDDNETMADSIQNIQDSSAYFTAAVGYTGHEQFKGYDNGLKQAGYSPSIAYNNPLGFSATISATKLTESGNWDEFDASFEYDYDFADYLGFSLSYSHSFYGTSNTKVNVGLTNDLGAGLNITTPVLVINPTLDYEFGNKSDIFIGFNFSQEIDLVSNEDGSNQLSITPAVSANLGTENFLNSVLRKKKVKGKIISKNVKTVNSSFGIMEYELDLPFNYQIGNFLIVPEYSYIFPVRQPVGEISNSFGYFSLNLSLNIY